MPVSCLTMHSRVHQGLWNVPIQNFEMLNRLTIGRAPYMEALPIAKNRIYAEQNNTHTNDIKSQGEI
jgi:hypothetical protein